jgi:hypothetical protein
MAGSFLFLEEGNQSKDRRNVIETSRTWLCKSRHTQSGYMFSFTSHPVSLVSCLGVLRGLPPHQDCPVFSCTRAATGVNKELYAVMVEI